MGSRHVDFDALWRENFGDPPTITAFGEEHTLPGELPAVVVLWQASLSDEDEATDADDQTIFDLLALVVGRSKVDHWLNEKKMGVRQAWSLLGAIGLAYNDEDERDPEAPAPETGPTEDEPSATSSKPGTASRPTSNAST